MRRNLFLAACAVLALAQTARAQRPVTTQSADEPGRSPYQSSAFSATPCLVFCIVSFDPVPAGKRLVITYLSATGQGTLNPVYLFALNDPTTARIQLLMGTDPDTGVRSFSAPLSFYIDGGRTPELLASGGTSMSGTLVGYLVSMP